MINLDGSHGEGGGQMLRTALVWSLITRTPFRMENIRAGRRPPGLKAQHVHVLKALRPLGPVEFTGAVEGSAVVTFVPAPLRGAEFRVDVGTAGSLTLLLQTLLPAVLIARGRSKVVLTGGTDVAWSPPLDHFRSVVWPAARARATHLSLDVERRGFYPKGGGRLVLEAEGGKSPPPLSLDERGELRQVRVFSFASADLQSRRVAERQSDAARERLARYGVPMHAEASYGPTHSPGSVVTCVAELGGASTLVGSALGERQKAAEKVGEEAAGRLALEVDSGAPVDEYGADQLLIWLALAGGVLRSSRFSDHTRTNLWVTERFLGSVFKLVGATVSCPATHTTPW